MFLKLSLTMCYISSPNLHLFQNKFGMIICRLFELLIVLNMITYGRKLIVTWAIALSRVVRSNMIVVKIRLNIVEGTPKNWDVVQPLQSWTL